MRVNEDGSSKSGCSDPKYCKDGKPNEDLKIKKGGGDKPQYSPNFVDKSIENPNPPLAGLVVVAVVFHVLTTFTELGVVAGEVALALGPDEFIPEIAIPLGLTLAAAGAAILDLDVSLLSYTVRVAMHPDEHQNFVLTPPWGLDDLPE